MDASGSEWSSGCESGWTVYLDESNSFYSNRYETATKAKNGRKYEEEEEDLSMVSDASSGPRHNFHEEEQQEEASYGSQGGFYNYHASSSSSSLKKKGERRKKMVKDKDPRGGGKYQNHQQASSYNHLDDTASSPALTYSKRHVPPSDNQASFFGLSSAEFKGSSVCDNRFRFWHSSNPKKPD